jgi:hypothetical protein
MLDILSYWIVPVFMRDVKKGSVPESMIKKSKHRCARWNESIQYACLKLPES